MRITNSMIAHNFLTNLNGNMNRLDKYQYQLATNRRITKLSDDPVGVVKSMEARVKLYRLEQYQKNLDSAETWLTQAETSLMELNSIVTHAYESTVQAASDLNNASDRKALSELIGQLREHIVGLANSKMGESYIFGGFNTGKKPFEADPAAGTITYNGLDMRTLLPTDPDYIAEQEQIVQVEIGYGVRTDMTITGIDFLGVGEENIYGIMSDLYDLLAGSGTADEISAQITKLQDAQSTTLAHVAEIGGRLSRIELVQSRYEDDYLNYTETKSKIEDADMAETIMNYKMAESVYLAALQAGAQIIQPNLLSYLR
ncbi:flagellar hook-associated protein FlgL [Eubacteriales bacterium OttesenSCG-928-M02]|nr:flagellar hook-associated protein FlgL [Eubacteriales bacterium OttesenSCG-928-M02]